MNIEAFRVCRRW